MYAIIQPQPSTLANLNQIKLMKLYPLHSGLLTKTYFSKFTLFENGRCTSDIVKTFLSPNVLDSMLFQHTASVLRKLYSEYLAT